MFERKRKLISPKTKALLGISLLVCLVTSFFIYGYLNREQHCVTGIPPEDGEPMGEPSPDKCFDTQAEALAYISNGRIVLPPNASPEEVQAAIEAYNSEMATLEAQGSE